MLADSPNFEETVKVANASSCPVIISGGVSSINDIKKAKEVLNDIVSSNEKVLKEEGITIAVSELADSSVNFVVRAWVKTPDYWDVKFTLTENVKLRFDEEGISIPYPQQDVHHHNQA